MAVKILFVGMTSNPGGLETYMINIFSKLQNRGFMFYFVNTSNKYIAYNDYIKKNNGIIYNIPFNGGIIKYFTRYHIAKQFFKLHHNFDIVHINALSINELYWAKAAKKYGIRHVVFQSHNSGVIYKSRIIALVGKILGYYNKKYLRYRSNINKLAASIDCGKFMFGPNSDFMVIPNGINTEYFCPSLFYRDMLRKELDINVEDKVLITTARLNKQKNYPKIINVFNYIHKLNHNTKLVIIGNGVELSQIKELVKSYNLTSSVYFLGVQPKSKISELLNIADLMIMPSFFEAIPFSLTEAQSEGIPAIVSSEGLPKEANITGKVIYVSLKKPDILWAKKSLNILKSYEYSLNLRKLMNKQVQKSAYNLNNSISKIKSYYISINKRN